MKLSEIGELSLLAGIRKRFRGDPKDVIAGIGDDSAVIAPAGQKILLTTDMMMEDVHFDLSFVTPYQLGFKIVSVNVSDIYAMCGTPRFMLLGLAVRKDTDDKFIKAFFSGIKEALKIYKVLLVGGDMSSSKSGMSIAATLVGYSKRPVMRSGAKPGDKIYVTGCLGDSACGLELLRKINRTVRIESGDKLNKPIAWNIMRPLIRRHLMPVARDSKRYASAATAMIDLSDGLFIDLSRLCDESRVGARIYMENIPVSREMKKAASSMGLDTFSLAASGGEDYELLFTAPKEKKVSAICIGEITGKDRLIVDIDGAKRPLKPKGYEHWH